ncbi:MAG: CBS domain-containing protein [Candidatus Thermoplasmatota archaeon]
MKVEDVMTEEIISVDKDENLRYVLKLMEKHNITKIPVVNDKKFVGIVTDNTIAYKLGSIRSKGVPASRLHASSVLEKDVPTVTRGTNVNEILKTVGEPGPTMINVVENDQLFGIVTKADLLPYVEDDQKVENIMKKDVKTVHADDRVIHARRQMIDEEIARMPVTHHGRLVGMVSDMDIAFAFAELKRSTSLGRQKNKLDKLLVEEAMKKPVIWTKPDMKISEAAKLMLEEDVGGLPILKDDKLVGIVTRTDLIKTISSL